jgi:hypothetical protein
MANEILGVNKESTQLPQQMPGGLQVEPNDLAWLDAAIGVPTLHVPPVSRLPMAAIPK